MSNFLGVDPGGSGAMAVIDEEGKFVSFIKLKETDFDVADWLKSYVTTVSFAYLEKVHSMPGQGVASTFKFGASFGGCRAMLVYSTIPWDFVTPLKWQNALSCRTGGDKNVSKAKAQQFWPDVKITHANADALLIAEYCRRVRLNIGFG